MKKTFFIISILFSTLSHAQFGSDCRYTNGTVEFTASNWAITPTTFYAKKGDKLCVKFKSMDNSKTLKIEKQPLFVQANPQKDGQGVILLNKEGEFIVSCVGCNSTAKIIVQSEKEFERMQNRLNQIESIKMRNPHLNDPTRK